MIVEMFHDPSTPIDLEYRYFTDSAYELTSEKDQSSWTFQLVLRSLSSVVEKRSTGLLFDPVIENPRCFKYVVEGRDVGYLQIGHQTWNNRLRIWDFLIDKEFRRSGIGTQLMDLAKKEARNLKARMLVLETQSCNVPAINFYLKNGFELIGFDAAHYSNQDLARQKFRLEFGLEITES